MNNIYIFILCFIVLLIIVIPVILFSEFFVKNCIKLLFLVDNYINKIVELFFCSYGYIDNKKINKREVPIFRDVPCNKDIYYANILIKLNDFNYNKFNIFGAIILKWIRTEKIIFENKKEGIFNKETSFINFALNPIFDNTIERILFEILYSVSDNGVLKIKKFEKWMKNNYDVFSEIFDMIEKIEFNYLKEKGYIYKRTNWKECSRKNIMNDKIYNDSIELYGLKKYLEEFSLIDLKEVIDVKLWDEYLMFAYLFGLADKVFESLDELHINILEKSSIDTLRFMESISYNK